MGVLGICVRVCTYGPLCVNVCKCVFVSTYVVMSESVGLSVCPGGGLCVCLYVSVSVDMCVSASLRRRGAQSGLTRATYTDGCKSVSKTVPVWVIV